MIIFNTETQRHKGAEVFMAGGIPKTPSAKPTIINSVSPCLRASVLKSNTTRRALLRNGAGLAAIIAAGKAPAALVRSMLAARNAFATSGKRLPYDAEVEYIGVDATIGPYIDTGYRWTTDNIKIDIEFLLTNNPSANTGLFGSQKVGQDTNWGIQYWKRVNRLVSHYIGRTSEVYNWLPTTGSKYHFVGETSSDHTWKITINGVEHTGSWSGTVCQDVTTIGLFSLYNNTNMTDRRTNNVCVYSFSLTDDGVLVRNFTPVRFTNENGQTEGAMYDRANPTVGMNPDGSPRTDGLYRNRGTGAFAYGLDKARGASAANGGGDKRKCVRRSYRRSTRPSARFWSPRTWKEAA